MVLVLGAGASKPYGLPLGTELRDSVIRAENNFALYQRVLDVEITKYQYAEFTKTLAHSGFSSVDAFLEENSEWLEIGKAAIALELLKAEWKSINNLFPPKQPKDHWYETLWSYLKAPSWSTFKKNKISIITFNYDRSLEHYLVTFPQSDGHTEELEIKEEGLGGVRWKIRESGEVLTKSSRRK